MATGAIIGGALAAVGGVASAVSSNKSVSKTNDTNMEIAQMNNEFNEKMLNKQMDFDKEMYSQQVGDQWNFYNDAKQNAWDMYNANNEYNSASAQRERLEAAGLNPYLMMSGGSAGTASSTSATSATAPSAQGVTPPSATPVSVDYNGEMSVLGTLIEKVLQQPEREKLKAETDNLRIEGKYKAAESIAKIANIKMDTKSKSERMTLDKLIYSIDKDLKTSQMMVNDQNIVNMRAEEKFKNIQTLMAEKQLSFMDASQKMDLAEKAANIQLRYAQGALTRKQVEHEIKKIAETEVRTSLGVDQITGQQLSNQAQRQQNQFDAATFDTRKRTLEETLNNLIFDLDSAGLVKTLGKGLQSGSKYLGRLYNDYIK